MYMKGKTQPMIKTLNMEKKAGWQKLILIIVTIITFVSLYPKLMENNLVAIMLIPVVAWIFIDYFMLKDLD